MPVWITRSEPGASRQGTALEAAGYAVLVAPVLTIEATDRAEPTAGFRVVIFLSEHAVRFGGSLGYCADASVYAVGGRTAEALEAQGIKAAVPPESSSEGLLALLEATPLNDERVLIVAGEGGRDLLGAGLESRGALVEVHACYRRQPVARLAQDLSGVNAILVASQDGFKAVARLWFSGNGAADVKVIAASARIASLGGELGFTNVQIAAGAAEADWLAALTATPTEHRNNH